MTIMLLLIAISCVFEKKEFAFAEEDLSSVSVEVDDLRVGQSIISIFPDSYIAEAVRVALSKPSINSAVTFSELATIKKLVAFEYAGLTPEPNSAKELTGLEYLTSLEDLQISGTRVSDLSPIKNLIMLRNLEISVTNISDFSQIAGLTNLENLSCSYTTIKDLTPLANMSQLKKLILFNSDVESVEPLRYLLNLETLNVVAELSDISPLAKLPKLTDLNIRGNKLSDPSILANPQNFTALRNLQITSQRISVDPVYLDAARNLNFANIVTNHVQQFIPPTNISDYGQYNPITNKISWSNLPQGEKAVSYDFDSQIVVNSLPYDYSGTVQIPILDGEPEPEFILGDVNQDGKVTLIDSLMLKRYLLDGVIPSHLNAELFLKAADMNQDGKVTLIDYVFLKKMLLQQ